MSLVRRRQLRAFVFVFETAHRIVVETPEYGNATYFFELESPMPVTAQVRGLPPASSAWRPPFRWLPRGGMPQPAAGPYQLLRPKMRQGSGLDMPVHRSPNS